MDGASDLKFFYCRKRGNLTIKLCAILFLLSLLISSNTATAESKEALKILFLGDSLTEGYGVAKDEAYPRQAELLLQKKFPGRSIQAINAGSSGSTSASAKSRLQWHLKSKPNILLLALGANDGLRGFSVAATEKNLQETIQLAQDNSIKVIIAGMQLPTNYGEKYRKDFAKIFPTLAKKHHTILIPFLLEGVGGNPKLNLADGIHPNEAGHKIIAETVIPYISKALE